MIKTKAWRKNEDDWIEIVEIMRKRTLPQYREIWTSITIETQLRSVTH